MYKNILYFNSVQFFCPYFFSVTVSYVGMQTHWIQVHPFCSSDAWSLSKHHLCFEVYAGSYSQWLILSCIWWSVSSEPLELHWGWSLKAKGASQVCGRTAKQDCHHIFGLQVFGPIDTRSKTRVNGRCFLFGFTQR